MDHKTKRIALKKIDVDEGILPVIEWLNLFDGIITQYSCEGNGEAAKVNAKPYVVFICSNYEDLRQIIHLTESFSVCEVYVDIITGDFRYTLRFHSVELMKRFVDTWLTTEYYTNLHKNSLQAWRRLNKMAKQKVSFLVDKTKKSKAPDKISKPKIPPWEW